MSLSCRKDIVTQNYESLGRERKVLDLHVANIMYTKTNFNITLSASTMRRKRRTMHSEGICNDMKMWSKQRNKHLNVIQFVIIRF